MKSIAIGFGIMAASFVAAYALTGNIGIALCVMAVTVVLLPCRYDPAIQIKERQLRPTCFGDYSAMSWSSRAEYDCHRCPHQSDCSERIE